MAIVSLGRVSRRWVSARRNQFTYRASSRGSLDANDDLRDTVTGGEPPKAPRAPKARPARTRKG